MSQGTGVRWVKELSPNELPRGLLSLCVLAFIGGAGIGVVGGAFRWCVIRADEGRNILIAWSQQLPVAGILVPITFAAATVALSRLLTRKWPEAVGGGVPRVEASLRGEMKLESLRVLPAKFVGGLLAIASGLALQREGPTIQMGGAIGSKLGRALKQPRSAEELEASVAGAGLGVAFNAPLGGAMFVLEELARAYRLRLILATLIAAATSITVARGMLGDNPIVYLGHVESTNMYQLIGFGIFGLGMGLLGAYYNKCILFFLHLNARITKIPPIPKAAIIGGIAGAIGYYFPAIIGGGGDLTQTMLTNSPLPWLILIILVFRFFFGPLSIAAMTPGGILTPLLLMGAIAGALFASSVSLIPFLELPVTSFAFVGMSAMFAGSLRAPLTGIILTVEMAASSYLIVPALMAAGGALLTATLVRSPPLYDSLAPMAAGYLGVQKPLPNPPGIPQETAPAQPSEEQTTSPQDLAEENFTEDWSRGERTNPRDGSGASPPDGPESPPRPST